MRTGWTPRDDVRSVRGALRVVGPGAVGAVGALATWLLVVQELEAPYLGNLIVDASSSVLSPSGFTVVLDIVGQAGKAVTLATTIILQFVVFVLLWAWATQYLEARDGLRQRWRFALIQLGMAFALFVILAAIFDLAAVSSVFSTADWLHYLWQTAAFTALFIAVAHALDRLGAPAPRAVARVVPVAEPPADATETPSATRPAPHRVALLDRAETRRGVLALAGGMAVFLTAAIFVGRVVADTAATGVRKSFFGRLPPWVTPNEAFYTVSKNFFDPVVDGATWRLQVDGLVDSPREFTLDELRALPAEQSTNTLMCISYEPGDDLISNARWVGTSLRDVLAEAGVQPRATHIQFTSADDYVESHALDYARDPRVRLVWEMNGVPLPHKHGFPLRLLAPGRYGIKNPKWITRITLIEGNIQGYWQQRGWDQEGVIKTMSRIDVPARGARGEPRRSLVEGIAFAGERGIGRVEVSTDDGQTWAEADLHDAPTAPLAWRFWSFEFDAEVGAHQLRARATDATGALQIAEESSALPDGSSGYHRRRFSVAPPA
ncbi:MAG: molybdopterin-dependent oxidoreductase [Chloroflexota bacterium]|nr:molybdopterin-dependent oxidoreductase [Chloroflexota bacterium]